MGSSFDWREENPRDPQHFSKWVEFGTRNSAGRGWLCYSQSSGPGVLLLHEFFGLQDSFKDYAERLSSHGFTVLAPDLYDGAITNSVEEATRMSDELDEARTMQRLEAAAEFLASNWHPRLGVVGFSLGGYLAYALARTGSVEAAVFFYFGAIGGDSEDIRGPLQVHLASDDEWDPLEDSLASMDGFRRAGIDVDVHVYPGTRHWFANPAVADAYNAEAAELAFQRTTDFLRHHLA